MTGERCAWRDCTGEVAVVIRFEDGRELPYCPADAKTIAGNGIDNGEPFSVVPFDSAG